MADNGTATTGGGPRTLGGGYFLGIPLGDLGWFASVLMGLATGFLFFFLGTFVAIVSLLVYNTAGHHTLDYAVTYKYVGLPLGVLMGVLALGYLGLMWSKRILRKA